MKGRPATKYTRSAMEQLPRISKWFGLIGLILIISPKINIISIPGQTAGLRIDDLFLAICSIPFLLSIFSGNIKVDSLGYGRIIFISLISFILAILAGWGSSFLYVLRLLEYSVFIYLGYAFRNWYSSSAIVWPVLIANAVAMVLQFAGLWGGFTSDGYLASVGRVVGLTAGPWEIGFILNILFVIFAYASPRTNRAICLVGAFILFLIILTESRASAVSFGLIFLITMLRGRRFGQLILVSLSIALLLTPILFLLSDKLTDRSANLLNVDNVSFVFDYYSSLSANQNFKQDYFDDVGESADVDASWLIRASHWAIALKEFFVSPFYLPFGLGPGTFGPALDGAWTRILVETGVVGVLCYAFFLRNIARVLPGGMLILMACVINMLFIDIHLSYKSMALILFLVGVYGGTHAKRGG